MKRYIRTSNKSLIERLNKKLKANHSNELSPTQVEINSQSDEGVSNDNDNESNHSSLSEADESLPIYYSQSRSDIVANDIFGKQITIEGILTELTFYQAKRGSGKKNPSNDLPKLNRFNKSWYSCKERFIFCPKSDGNAKNNLVKRVKAIETRSGRLNFCVEFEDDNIDVDINLMQPNGLTRWIPYNVMKNLEPKDCLREFTRKYYLSQQTLFFLLDNGFEIEVDAIVKMACINSKMIIN